VEAEVTLVDGTKDTTIADLAVALNCGQIRLSGR